MERIVVTIINRFLVRLPGIVGTATCRPKRPNSRLGGRAAALAGLAGLAVATTGMPARAANESVEGTWWSRHDPDWPIIPVHAALTPDGRVMTYGTALADANGHVTDPTVQTGKFVYDVWDPSFGLDGGHLTLPNTTSTDLFCSAQLILPQSLDMLIVGGDNWTGTQTTNTGNNNSNLFRFSNNSLTTSANMNLPRWYATMTTLPNGGVYIQGGLGGGAHPEGRLPGGGFQVVTGVDTSGVFWSYPRAWVAPNGQIFGYSDRTMYYVDWHGTGTIAAAGDMPVAGPSGVTSTEVMYRPGKILRVGGGAYGPGVDSVGKNAAVIIDINGPAPIVTPTSPMPRGLNYGNATVIPDGRVVVTGGELGNNVMNSPNYNALIWNPVNGQWTWGSWTGSGMARMYHSNALLLPGGMILVTGGGAPGPQANNNAEIYYPPNLFDASNNPATRPLITQAPSTLNIGQNFSMSVDNGAVFPTSGTVALIKTGAVTHGFNMDQRYIPLSYTRSGNQLTVKAPTSANVAPPGMYLLFVLNNKGVPSWGRMARMNISATAAAAIAATPQGGSASAIAATPQGVSASAIAATPQGVSASRRGPPWSDPLWEKRLPKGWEKLM